MRVGLIARSEDRGLGNLTWAFHEHVQPDRTLVVDMGPFARGFAPHHDRYPDALIVPWNQGELPEPIVRDWLDGLDVLYSAETFYDPRLVSWARDAHVRTVLHVMPEFYRADLPQPDVIWTPTRWRLDTLPSRTRVVPVPMTRPSDVQQSSSSMLRVLHIAGNRAAGDRNGTILVVNALRYVTQPMHVRVETQGVRLPSQSTAPHVQLDRHVGGRGDRWAMYDDVDVLLMPRRYGGLCLPVLEAMTSGVAVMMPNVVPNDEWPIIALDATQRGSMEAPAGTIPMTYVEPRVIAAALDQLVLDSSVLAHAQLAALRWAQENSWERLLPLYRDELLQALT